MSHTLADLATWLPSEFLTGHVFSDFASSSSTESESDDDEIAGLTRCFTRSVSFQERLKIPHPLEKRGFSGSPESGLNWNVSVPTQARSSPATPFGQANEDSRDLIYATARQVARMKMKINAVSGGVFDNRGLLGAPLSHYHYEEFIRQQEFRWRVAGGTNYDCGGRCATDGPVPVGFREFRQSAWPPLPVENQRRQPPPNVFVVKPVAGGFTGDCGRGSAVVKKERSGTGVFLPRSYCNIPPESKKNPACSPTHLPAGIAQSFNKIMDPIIPPPIHGGFAPQYPPPPPQHHHFKRDELAELLTAKRNAAVMLPPQRRSTTHVGQPEVVLPQEWTY